MDNQLALLEQAQSTFIDLAIKFGPKAVVAIAILITGAGDAGSEWVVQSGLDGF